jgi:hypothetical protein
MDNTNASVRAAKFLATIVREVDPLSRVVSVGDVDDGYFILFARQSRLAGGCTLELSTVARAIAGDEAAHEEILADFRRCLDGFAA